MAVMVPEAPADFNNSQGELDVFNALRGLDDRCYVFHSLRWLGNPKYGRKKPQGEADFAIFDPQRGLLIIEVKSGLIRFEAGSWYQTNRATGVEKLMKDPEQQASSTKFEFLPLFKNSLPPAENCLIGTAVWFPSGTFPKQPLPLNLHSDIVLDEESLNSPKAAISAAFDYWGQKFGHHLSQRGQERVISILAPTFKVIPSLKAGFAKRAQQFIQMTRQQASIIDFLDEQEVAVISGTAGTGKTVVALEKARRLSEFGESILFLCYNSALRNFLKQEHHLPGVDFHTFHSVARKLVGDAPTFDLMAEKFLEHLSNPTEFWPYQHVIIDEGQDFSDEWLEWLTERTDGCKYIFYDKKQLIFRDTLPNWVVNADCRLVLTKNCRNTLQISRTAYRFANLFPGKPGELVAGFPTKLHDCGSSAGIGKRIKRIVGELLNQDAVQPEDIAILTMSTVENSLLANLHFIHSIPLVESFEKGKICFTTVRKFKGLEARVIFIVDFALAEFAEPNFSQRLYVGCSRARDELHLFVEGCDDVSIKLALEAIQPGTKLISNRKNLSKLLDAEWHKEH
ncbi:MULTISPECIES: ATP-binding domain-containing protein [Cyanophyceae]|uniref:nuclease-related domain-containing DEAD/DEAH box helicase n=1 Tax=Cyanophyceae TaxID=3028117 RepID=UPI0016827015|nr:MULTISPECIES: ATP-binding domain-containing protein [Cyanophyceae]MBD1916248.1 AAA family ATPase [Phormidium sp. FACHB-77]MBD2031483.1 AAA family ATPase [Phormidium sp. FACHB-322]MBD2052890.1 AAA family ATPase [Leptolyngbya sp. FACHB-60]